MTEHQDDTPIVAAAREAEHRQTIVEQDVKAILGHTERMDVHLGTLNHRTEKNELAIADTRVSFTAALAEVRGLILNHVRESEDRNLYNRVTGMETNMTALLKAHEIDDAVASDRKKWFSNVFSALDKLGAKAVPYALVGLILKQLGIF